MRTTLFSNRIMRAIKIKKPRRVYDVNDVFPYGSWAGQTLRIVATFDPEAMERWISKNKISVTPQLQTLINHSKHLAQ